MSGTVHGVSVYFGSVPGVLCSTKLNFGPLSKTRPKSFPEQATSLDFVGFRVDSADCVAVGPYDAADVMFMLVVCITEWQGQ
jgi:hypothetical protein